MPGKHQRTACISAAASAILLLALIAAYLHEGPLAALDRALVDAIASWRTPAVTTAFLWLTAFGAGPALTAVALAASGLMATSSRARLLLPLWITFLGAEATTWTGKYLIGRARPDFVTEAVVSSPSFPSAHATGAMAVYGILAWVIVRGRPPGPLRYGVLAFAGALVLTVGFSRVLLAVHYPTDVLAGWLIGVLWLSIGVCCARDGATCAPDNASGNGQGNGQGNGPAA